jgi:hypothetical protein
MLHLCHEYGENENYAHEIHGNLKGEKFVIIYEDFVLRLRMRGKRKCCERTE